MELQRFDRNAGRDEIVAALRDVGAVILTEQVDAGIADAVARELRPSFDTAGRETESDFNGYSTLRLSAILARSRSSAELIGHQRVLDIIDPILLPHCINYRTGSCTGIEVLPGETDQELHTDASIYPIRIPGVEWQVNVMWALDDFTAENGATRVVPYSHVWRGPERPPTDGVVQAIMAKGSALVYLGSVLHGSGANRTDASRIGLINTYSLGWLRQEENHYLTIPREIADSYPERIRWLIGYRGHGTSLGWYPEMPELQERRDGDAPESGRR